MGTQSKQTDQGLDRREFIRRSAYVGSGLALSIGAGHASSTSEGDLPTRILGRTGEHVTILGLGTAPIGEGPVDAKEASRIFEAVIERGVNYIDTARIYGNAEEALGPIIPKYRDKLFLVTKVWTDNGKKAEESLNESLRLLKTDHADLVHIHHIGGKDIEKVLADDGVLNELLKQKKAGKLRFIGLSGHACPSRFLEMLKTTQIDIVMPVMNYADRNTYNFEGRVLPECRKQNVGVVAMKVYAGIKGGFKNHRNGSIGCITPDEHLQKAMAYALDLEGVSSAIVGPYTMEQALQNIEFAKNYKPLSDAERKELLAYGVEVAEQIGPRYGSID